MDHNYQCESKVLSTFKREKLEFCIRLGNLRVLSELLNDGVSANYLTGFDFRRLIGTKRGGRAMRVIKFLLQFDVNIEGLIHQAFLLGDNQQKTKDFIIDIIKKVKLKDKIKTLQMIFKNLVFLADYVDAIVILKLLLEHGLPVNDLIDDNYQARSLSVTPLNAVIVYIKAERVDFVRKKYFFIIFYNSICLFKQLQAVLKIKIMNIFDSCRKNM